MDGIYRYCRFPVFCFHLSGEMDHIGETLIRRGLSDRVRRIVNNSGSIFMHVPYGENNVSIFGMIRVSGFSTAFTQQRFLRSARRRLLPL